MSDVAAHSVISPALARPQASPTPGQVPASVRAPRKDALRCTACSMRSICMPQGLTPEELQRIESLICPSRTIKQGEAIYRANDTFQNIYAVRVGSFMAQNTSAFNAVDHCLARAHDRAGVAACISNFAKALR